MKGLWLLSLVPFLVATQSAYAAEVTVTLQNGLDGYTGCDDACITDFSPSENFGGADRLPVEYQEVKSVSC